VSTARSAVVLHLRLWWQFALTDAMRLLEYRANLAFGLARQVASLALTVLAFGLLYQYTDEIAGWSRAELLVLVGIFWTFNSVWDLLLDGLTEVSRDVREGTMDFVLLRPVSAQFFLSLRRVWLLDGAGVLLGLGLVVSAGTLAGVQWSVGQALLGTLDPRLVPLGPLLAAGSLYASHRFWRLAVRHYSSATS
jgi:ABC-2 type transport system permease protein